MLITYADGSCESRFFVGVCLSVYTHDISRTDAARIIKLDNDVQMFHDESRKFIYFVVKRSWPQVTKTLPAWVIAYALL